MSVKIYTYADPYAIDKESSFWDEIKDCVQFCVSQTLVNGMVRTYPHYKELQCITTIRNFINKMYPDWENLTTRVRQIMEVDNAINSLVINRENTDNIKRSLLFNTKSIVACIRIFKELGLEPDCMKKVNITSDQELLVEIYDKICKNEYSAFEFTRVFDETAIDKAIKDSLVEKYSTFNPDNVNLDTIVIHGIHQFTPAMLCAIEDIGRYKNIVLLFNYQKQYQEIYETWLNIYSLFDVTIQMPTGKEFHPIPLMVNSYKSNLLADSIGKIARGESSNCNEKVQSLEIIEFDNITEFANYVAAKFDKAKNKAKQNKEYHSELRYMDEQFYSASRKVNDILRAYFPEQFGERHFLDYPIGHFFVSTANMWDAENKKIVVNDFSDLKECLCAGIINESVPGVLMSTFNKVEAYLENEIYLDEIIIKLKNLKKYLKSPSPEQNMVEYYNVEKIDLLCLINALEELKEIIEDFFSDFYNNTDNFRRFYKRIRQFIINKVNDEEKLDDEMREVISKLLDRLNESNLPDTGTFNCLKQTMSFYLSQDDNVNKGAYWIVRGFEQIDGDILLSRTQDATKTTYHFCSLSDKDICSAKDERLPWPLDTNFFEYVYDPVDIKYQIFLKSKMEHHNFNRYALLYGLEFNRVGCKLSYIRTENEKDNDVFHIFSLLGLHVKKYKNYTDSSYSDSLQFENAEHIDSETVLNHLDTIDICRFNLCKYRFVLESIIQEKTVHRNRFLVHLYMRVLIRNRVLTHLEGMTASDDEIREKIFENYQTISDKIKISDELEKTQLVADVYSDLKYRIKNGKFSKLSCTDLQYAELEKFFLITNYKLYPTTRSDIDIKELLDGCIRIPTDSDRAKCKYCSCKDICLKALS